MLVARTSTADLAAVVDLVQPSLWADRPIR